MSCIRAGVLARFSDRNKGAGTPEDDVPRQLKRRQTLDSDAIARAHCRPAGAWHLSGLVQHPSRYFHSYPKDGWIEHQPESFGWTARQSTCFLQRIRADQSTEIQEVLQVHLRPQSLGSSGVN